MFPIRDINPTRTTPIVTVVFIAINLLVFFSWQPRSGPVEEAEFLYENAAIACELTEGEALTVAEIQREDCGAGGALAYPDKNVYLAALVSMQIAPTDTVAAVDEETTGADGSGPPAAL